MLIDVSYLCFILTSGGLDVNLPLVPLRDARDAPCWGAARGWGRDTEKEPRRAAKTSGDGRELRGTQEGWSGGGGWQGQGVQAMNRGLESIWLCKARR